MVLKTIIGIQNSGWLVSGEEGCWKADAWNLRDAKKKIPEAVVMEARRVRGIGSLEGGEEGKQIPSEGKWHE